jgi:hypothetical protein
LPQGADGLVGEVGDGSGGGVDDIDQLP